MKIFVVADADTCLAFALAGIEGQAVETAAEVGSILHRLTQEKSWLILITEPLAESSREAIDRMLLEPGGSLILEIPTTRGPAVERARTTDRIVSLLRR
jgi:vacuolar-type H+-ATPase subunit F/Vma7